MMDTLGHELMGMLDPTQDKVRTHPMVVGLRLDEFDQEEAEVEEPFRSLVGHLM